MAGTVIGIRPGSTATQAWWRATARLLVLSFLLQPVLNYLVAPVVATTDIGQVVVRCAMMQNGGPMAPDAPGHDRTAEYCPALTLLQIAGTAVFAPPVPEPVPAFCPAADRVQPLATPPWQQLHSPYSSRAPPVA